MVTGAEDAIDLAFSPGAEHPARQELILKVNTTVETLASPAFETLMTSGHFCDSYMPIDGGIYECRHHFQVYAEQLEHARQEAQKYERDQQQWPLLQRRHP